MSISPPAGDLVAHRVAADLRDSPTYWAQRHQPAGEASISVEARWELLRQHGNFTMAYSVAFQPHLQYFGDGQGLVAYRQRRGIVFALGDPLCGEGQRRGLLGRFLARFPRASFVQVSRSTAVDLQELGLMVNEMGIDTRLDLASYDFRGKDKEWLRYGENYINRHGYSIREFRMADEESAVVRLSDAWRATRQVKRKEVRFLNRPIVLADEPDVRRFALYRPDGAMEAFVQFDPLYCDGRICAYTSSVKRRLPDACRQAEAAVMKRAISQFQAEGIASVWLGLSPLAGIEDREFRCNRGLSRWARYWFRAGWINRWFYHLKGHAEYKQRFRGEEHRVYYASPVRFNGFRLLTLASLCGIF